MASQLYTGYTPRQPGKAIMIAESFRRWIDRNTSYLLGAMGLLVWLTLPGCTTFNAFPYSARAGDTISLAVGSPDGMTRANTTVTFVSDADLGNPVDLTSNVNSIFNLYGDKRSAIFQLGSGTDQIVGTSGHEPWLTVVAINLPTGLQTGPGKFQINTTASYPTIGSHINNFPISVDILPGTGLPQVFDYEFGLGTIAAGNLVDLEPAPHTVIRPPFAGGTAGWPDYGAIELKLNMPTTAGATLSPQFVRTVLDDMRVKTGSNISLVTGLNNGEDLTVMLISPNGTLKYFESRLSVVIHTAFSFVGTPSITSVRYFDINGAQTTGPLLTDFSVSLE